MSLMPAEEVSWDARCMKHFALAQYHAGRKEHARWKMTAKNMDNTLSLVAAFLLECIQEAEDSWWSLDCTCIDQDETLVPPGTFRLGASWASHIRGDVANLEDLAEYDVED